MDRKVMASILEAAVMACICQNPAQAYLLAKTLGCDQLDVELLDRRSGDLIPRAPQDHEFQAHQLEGI